MESVYFFEVLWDQERVATITVEACDIPHAWRAMAEEIEPELRVNAVRLITSCEIEK